MSSGSDGEGSGSSRGAGCAPAAAASAAAVQQRLTAEVRRKLRLATEAEEKDDRDVICAEVFADITESMNRSARGAPRPPSARSPPPPVCCPPACLADLLLRRPPARQPRTRCSQHACAAPLAVAPECREHGGAVPPVVRAACPAPVPVLGRQRGAAGPVPPAVGPALCGPHLRAAAAPVAAGAPWRGRRRRAAQARQRAVRRWVLPGCRAALRALACRCILGSSCRRDAVWGACSWHAGKAAAHARTACGCLLRTYARRRAPAVPGRRGGGAHRLPAPLLVHLGAGGRSLPGACSRVCTVHPAGRGCERGCRRAAKILRRRHMLMLQHVPLPVSRTPRRWCWSRGSAGWTRCRCRGARR